METGPLFHAGASAAIPTSAADVHNCAGHETRRLFDLLDDCKIFLIVTAVSVSVSASASVPPSIALSRATLLAQFLVQFRTRSFKIRGTIKSCNNAFRVEPRPKPLSLQSRISRSSPAPRPPPPTCVPQYHVAEVTLGRVDAASHPHNVDQLRLCTTYGALGIVIPARSTRPLADSDHHALECLLRPSSTCNVSSIYSQWIRDRERSNC